MSDRFWLGLFSAYFLFHILLRVATAGALGLDEAEILLDARHLAWGYGPQLPLYAWLQWGVFQITGPTIFGLSLLKNALLLATVIALYTTVRSRRSPLVAGLSVLSLLMLYQFSWESQRALTHTVLVNLSSVLTFAMVWRLSLKPSTAGYIALGVVIAIGGLSKYNYAFAFGAIMLAALSASETRRAILTPKLIVSVAIAALLLAGPVFWILQNPDRAFASAHKFDMESGGGSGWTVVLGLAELAVAASGFVSLLAVVAALLWLFCRRQDTPQPADDLQRFLSRILLWSICLLAIAVAASGSTNVKDRWLQPVLIFAGPAIMLWVLPRLNDVGLRRFAQVSAAFAGLIGVAMLHHNLLGDAKRAAPFAVLTPQILGAAPSDAAIVAPVWYAGNMAYLAPDKTIQSARDPAPNMPIIRVWDADDKPPKDVDSSSSGTVSAPYRFDDDVHMSLSFGPVIH